METKVITEKQNLKYLQWSHSRKSSGTAGTFLKSQETIDGKKYYYKLSNFDSEKGVIGHECINEIIVDRLLNILGVDHLHYQLVHADIEIYGKTYETWLSVSEDFKDSKEKKAALDDFLLINSPASTNRYEACKEFGWEKYIDTMIAVDYLIMNRDRHGANIEVLSNPRQRKIRIAPLFDHGLSFLYSCTTDEEIAAFDIRQDRPCQNFIGSKSTLENLSLIKDKGYLFDGRLTEDSRDVLFDDLDGILSKEHLDKIWDSLFTRYKYYESICNS